MDPFEPIPVDTDVGNPQDDPAGLSEDEKAALPKVAGPYYDAADVGLAAANAAAFLAISGIGNEVEHAVTGGVEAYGDPIIGSTEMIDDAVAHVSDTVGPQAELSDGCSGCAAALLVLLTLSTGTALALTW